MIKVYPAILTNNVEDFKKKIKLLSFAKIIQIDFSDGKFVNSKTLMPKDIRKINKKLEFHLMIKSPEKCLDEFMALKPYSIIVHYESTRNIKEILKRINSKKIRVGIAINPKTNPKKIIDLLNLVDFILVMTVNPGKQGNKFLEKNLEKVKYLRSITNKPIEVDGHINDKTAKLAVKSGADILVSGSYILKGDSKKNYKSLLKF